MPIDYRKNAAMRHRALMMTVDMDEPMGGYPKSKAPELVVEPVVAMPNGGSLYGPAPPIFLDAASGEPVDLPTLSPGTRLGVVGGTWAEPAARKGGWPKGKPRKAQPA